MSKKQKSVEQTYQKKSQLEHILLRPDTYIGSIEKQSQQMWVWNDQDQRIVNNNISFVPGLYKIFDEIIVNAADNKQRDSTMTRIDVDINTQQNSIRVWNNGQGIPVVVHKEHQIYVPELIFGHLLTGSNFDDEEAKTTGGRNGYGAKLTNIFSNQFIVETADSASQLKYKQVFRNNMSVINKPDISPHKGTDYTCITFFPDLKRFKMDLLDQDIVSLFSKRVYDVAGTCFTSSGGRLNVYLNGKKLEKVPKFSDYLTLYEGIEPPIAFERVNERWEVGVGISDGTFQQVSFVNSICTSKGGCHVNYIADQVTNRLVGLIKRKNKGEEVKANQIKNHIAIFVNALIVNPAFDSQTKETLTTKVSAFGSTCQLSEKMFKQIEKSSIVENVLNWSKFKQTAQLKKKSGTKRSKLLGIAKLDDANCAGTAKSHQCTLILTEGDSAKSLAISGLGVIGRDFYGVFPLRGKLLNVREASHAQIMKNEEIQNISKILGLTFGKVYEDTSSLRYGHVMIMTDQDHDGSHIKGLLINFFHYFWPSLLQLPGFLQQFITPIVKCHRVNQSKEELSFFTIPEYQQWKEKHGDGKGWKIKYYKGLGTSTAAEAKQYFSQLSIHEIDFRWNESSADTIDMAFAKKRVEDRRMWLIGLQPGTHIDYKVNKIPFDTFVNRELILFSHADNERSIAHIMDGLKPSQRKVLFACFKRNLKQEIKVAQLAGYVSEHSAYHHGEQSLTQTIIGMAQCFVGSNNINLLSPCGQFGTRLMGGKDAASARYVFTKLETITRTIFHPDDDSLLDYLDDDGQVIEPEYYVPILPMILVNGCEGIGTGWSTSIPTYNPREIVKNLRLLIANEEPFDMQPWYRGFKGSIQNKEGSSSFTVTGIVDAEDDQTVVISELPVGKWTSDYKQFLEGSLIGNTREQGDKDKNDGTAAVTTSIPFVKDFKENHTDTTVLFTVTVADNVPIDDNEKLVKKLKLDGSISTTNMHLFDLSAHIRKFDGPLHILRDFFKTRLVYYDKRKEMLIKRLTEEWDKLHNKARFLQCVIDQEIVLNNRKKRDLLLDIKALGFHMFSAGEDWVGGSDAAEESDISALEKGYDYLLSLKLWNLTAERVKELEAQRDAKQEELKILQRKTAEILWSEDLDAFEAALTDFELAHEQAQGNDIGDGATAKSQRKPVTRKPSLQRKTSTSKVTKRKAKATSDDESTESEMLFDSDGDSTAVDEQSVHALSRKPSTSSVSSRSTTLKRTNTASSIASTSSGMQPSITSEVPIASQQRSIASFFQQQPASSTEIKGIAMDCDELPPTTPSAPGALQLSRTVSATSVTSKGSRSTSKATTANKATAAAKAISPVAKTSAKSATKPKLTASRKKNGSDLSGDDSDNSSEELIDDESDSDLEDSYKKKRKSVSAPKSQTKGKLSNTATTVSSTKKSAATSKKRGRQVDSDDDSDVSEAVPKSSTRRSAASSAKDSAMDTPLTRTPSARAAKKQPILELADSSSEAQVSDTDSDYVEKPKKAPRKSIATSRAASAKKTVESAPLIDLSEESVLQPPPSVLPPSSAYKTPKSRRKSLDSDEDTPPSLFDRLKARMSLTPSAKGLPE